MMNRFTAEAQEVLDRGQQIMVARHHKQLDVEHIFLALLQRRDGLPAEIIRRLGGNIGSIARQLESYLNNLRHLPGEQDTTDGYITLRANRVLQGAAAEADLLEDDVISVEHLLLAIAGEHGGASGKIIQEEKLDKGRIYAALVELGRILPEEAKSLAKRSASPRKNIVNPPSLIEPRGYNHSIVTQGGHTLYLAGQTALDAKGEIVAPGNIVEQYRQVLNNMQAVVEAAGGTLRDIVTMTIYVRFMDDYKGHLKELGVVHKEFFGAYYPATALIGVERLFDDDALIEIVSVAVLGDK